MGLICLYDKMTIRGFNRRKRKIAAPGARESRYVARFNASGEGFDAGGEEGRNTDGWNLTADKFERAVLKRIFISASEIFQASFD